MLVVVLLGEFLSFDCMFPGLWGSAGRAQAWPQDPPWSIIFERNGAKTKPEVESRILKVSTPSKIDLGRPKIDPGAPKGRFFFDFDDFRWFVFDVIIALNEK